MSLAPDCQSLPLSIPARGTPTAHYNGRERKVLIGPGDGMLKYGACPFGWTPACHLGNSLSAPLVDSATQLRALSHAVPSALKALPTLFNESTPISLLSECCTYHRFSEYLTLFF